MLYHSILVDDSLIARLLIDNGLITILIDISLVINISKYKFCKKVIIVDNLISISHL